MFVTIHQPEFMPWAAFFEKMLRTDRFVILDSVKYQKNYFLNRCRIKQQGKATWLTVPVMSGSSAETIAEKHLADQAMWGKKVFNTLYFTYRPAPYWSAHEAFFEQIFRDARWEHLVDLNMALLRYLADALDIPFVHSRSRDMALTQKGSDLVLNICQVLNADRYLSGAHGQDYLDEAAFKAAGIEVVYQDYEAVPYEQFNGAYCGPLSVIDLLLNKGRDARSHIEAGRKA